MAKEEDGDDPDALGETTYGSTFETESFALPSRNDNGAGVEAENEHAPAIAAKAFPKKRGTLFRPNAGPDSKAGKPAQERLVKCKRIPAAWKKMRMLQHVTKALSTSTYRTWLQDTREHDPYERVVVFDSVGRAPVDRPPHPARLTPIKDLLEDDDDPEKATVTSLHRSFSQQCCGIISDQDEVKAFDAMNIYYRCDFFKDCAPGFMRELVQAGGALAFVGKSVLSGETVYEKDDPCQSLYIVARGIAEICKIGLDVELVGPGGYFGQEQILGILSRRHQTVRARTSLHLFEVTTAVLTKLLKVTIAEENAKCGLNVKYGSGVKGSDCLYPDERRYFEQLAVHMYREMTVGQTSDAASRAEAARGGGGGKGSSHGLSRGRSFSKQNSSKSQGSASETRGQSPRSVMSAALGASKRMSGIEAITAREAAQAKQCDSLISRVNESIRGDLRNNFMMPVDSSSARRTGSRRSLLSAVRGTIVNTPSTRASTRRSEAPGSSSRMSCMSQTTGPSPGGSRMSSRMSQFRASSSRASYSRASPTSSHVSKFDDVRATSSRASVARFDVEEISIPATADDDPLVAECLPSLADLGSVQKVTILKQLKSQVKNRSRRPSPFVSKRWEEAGGSMRNLDSVNSAMERSSAISWDDASEESGDESFFQIGQQGASPFPNAPSRLDFADVRSGLVTPPPGAA